jgi:hypothetical protein
MPPGALCTLRFYVAQRQFPPGPRFWLQSASRLGKTHILTCALAAFSKSARIKKGVCHNMESDRPTKQLRTHPPEKASLVVNPEDPKEFLREHGYVYLKSVIPEEMCVPIRAGMLPWLVLLLPSFISLRNSSPPKLSRLKSK